MINRRRLLATSGALLALAACRTKLDETQEMLARAKTLIARQPSFDLHAHPGRTFLRGAENLSLSLKALSLGGANEEQAIADMQAGGMQCAVFSAVSDLQVLELGRGGLSASRNFKAGEAFASYRTQIDHLNKLFDAGLAEKIISPDDVYSISAKQSTKALLGVEGGDFLEGSILRVEEAYADGVRCITPVHYRHNEIGDTMTAEAVHQGISQAGVSVIKAMNKAGIIIDIAHASEQTALGMLEASEAPVFCSHAHIRTDALDAPRFISQDLAKQIAQAGGVIGAWPAGIGISDLNGFIDRVFELIDIVGIDHVGLGTDMDANYKPVWDNYRQFPEVVAGLLSRGLSEVDAAKVIGGNGIRVFKAVAQS